jgi:hypothetical protein
MGATGHVRERARSVERLPSMLSFVVWRRGGAQVGSWDLRVTRETTAWQILLR